MFPQLYKRAQNGRVCKWEVHVHDDTIRTVYGSGKMVEKSRTVLGKNIGKKNETSSHQQAINKATSLWQKKINQGYVHLVKCITALPKPMLAHDYTIHYKKIIFPCFVQPKLDGVRALYVNGQFLSRNGNVFKGLDHICVTTQTLILDGELYSQTLAFQEFSGLLKKKDLTSEDLEKLRTVHFFVYDCVINDVMFLERHKQIISGDCAHVLETYICNSSFEVKQYHDTFVQKGYEGVILRNFNGLYQNGFRSYDLQKYKIFMENEFKVVNYSEEHGGLIMWICITDNNQIFTVRPRGSHAQRAAIFQNNPTVYIGKMLTVRFQEYTTVGIPRFPVGIIFRDYE
jgi:ATP-dependent DNA ligase